MRKNFVRIIVALIGISFVASLVTPLPAKAETSATTSDNTFVYATLGDPQTLDPALDYDSAGEYVLQQVYETLITYDRDKTDQYIPMLADTWTISPDGLTYTFHIRQGVHFHNGDTMTVEDVAYSFWRGLLQGGSVSPQWLMSEPLLGSGITDVSLLVDPTGWLIDNRDGMKAANPTKLLSACNTVKSKITYDNTTGNVVFHLAQAWSPFLVTLIGTWASVMDEDWVISNGGWNGSCTTWQNYYAMQYNEDPFTSLVNGTGPFKLDYWTVGSEIGLSRNDSYWRTTPIWPNGPSGKAALQQVTIKNIVDDTTRVNMLLNGSADLADVMSTDYPILNNNVLLRYDAAGLTSTFDNPSGTLLAYDNILGNYATDGFFNYNISASSPYTGTGSLGNGIPVNFFSDIHVRKAFNYAFDWDAFITQAYGGNAIQRTGPIIKGDIGYADTQPHYSYNPTQAANEFGQAFGGSVTENGFILNCVYNQGNIIRQKMCEVLKAGIEALNSKFQVNIISLPWSNFVYDQEHGNLPFFVAAWMEDIPDPYNWVEAYTINNYADWQNLPQSLKDKYSSMATACLAKLGDEARVCYENIQTTTYDDALDIFGVQPIRTIYMSAEVRGYYNNPATFGPYLYALSKGPLPTVSSVTPDNAAIVSFNDGQGDSGSIAMPAGSVSVNTQIVVTPALTTSGEPSGFRLGNLAFNVQGYKSSDGSAVDLTFTAPVQITLMYTDASRGPLVEDSLRLFYWNGSSWEDAACGDYVRDPAHDTITVPVCHFSQFALGGTTIPVFLPITFR